MARFFNHQTLILLATLLAISVTGERAPDPADGVPAILYWPAEPVQYRAYGSADGRRRLGPFQLCLSCKCCPSDNPDPGLCATLPCCFGIDCALPDKPYGVCAFVPKACNCTGCGM